MELAPRGTLPEYLRKSKEPIEFEEKIKLGLCCARALNYLHSLGIAHRDVCPRNILVFDRGFAKLGGLGLAKPLSGNNTLCIGSLSYTAPELFDPDTKGSYKVHCDIFSLGMVLCELLAGAKIERRPKGVPSFPEGNLPEDLKRFIESCVHKSPDARPTISAIVNKLEQTKE